MTLTGSGSGGSIGGPIQPTIYELETNAATNTAKAYLKVVADTLDIPLLQMDYSALRYQSSANRPVLPNALFSERVNTGGPQTGPSDAWVSTYDNLLQLLPPDFQAAFLANLQLPRASQNPNFVIFNNVLQQTAQNLTWLSGAAAPLNEQSLAAFSADFNLVFSFIAMNTIVKQSESMLTSAWSYLETVGANDPNFNALSNFSTQYEGIIDNLKSAVGLIKDPSTNEEGLALFASTATSLAALSNEFDTLYAGNDFLLLGANLHALSVITAALSLDQPGSAPLLIGLSLATQSTGTNESALGIFGPSYSALVDGLANFMIDAYMPNANIGTQTYLSQLLEVGLALAIVYGNATYNGAGIPETDPPTPESRSDINFAYGLSLLLLTESGNLSSTAQAITDGIGAPDNVQGNVTSSLSTIILLVLILAGTNGTNPTSTTTVMNTLSAELQQGINNLSNYVSNGLLNGTLSGDGYEQLGVSLQQANIALEDGDYDSFIGALETSVGLTGTTLSGILTDMQSINGFWSSVNDSLDQANDNTLNTGISTAV